MMKHHKKLVQAAAGCLLLVACVHVALAQTPGVSLSDHGHGPCKSMAPEAGYEHMVSLARRLESSGKLANYIQETYPKSKLIDTMAEAGSEPEPVKRSPDEEESKPIVVSNVTTTTPSALDTIKAMVIASTGSETGSSPTTVAPATVAPVAAAKSESSATPSGVNSTTPAPKATVITAASNVTVNVFLQLAPDAKTDDLINNPDKAISTPAPASSTTESAASAASASSPAPSAASSSTGPSANSTAAAAAASPAPVVTVPAPQKPEIAVATEPSATWSMAPKPWGSRRRRRWAVAPVAVAPAAPVATPAPKQVTSSTTTTTTTTTTAAPSSTTTTSAPSTTTTTTTTTTPAPPASTTAKVHPIATTSTTTTIKPKATSTTVATVEVSAKDLVAAASNQAAKEVNKPVEIVVSSVASPPAPSAAPAAATTPATTTTTTTTTTTAKPAEPSSTTTSTTTTTPAPKASTSSATASAASPPASPVVVAVVAPAAAPAAAKPVEQGPVAGMQQLISSCEEATSHLTIANNNEEQKTTIIKLHHSNEVKREIEEVHSGPQQQQQHERRDQDKPNELALDNSNVIYDNDAEHINLNYPTPANGGSDLAQRNDQTKTQTKHSNVEQSSSTSSFVHREHTDEIQEGQDNYATCLLVRAVGADANGNITNLAGRLNFWQPIQNRGVAHMIARFRYDLQDAGNRSSVEVVTSSKDGNTEPVAASGSGQLRLRRESFQAPIERAPPSLKDQQQTDKLATASATMRPNALSGGGHQLVVHQIWLHDNDNYDCGTSNHSEARPRRLVAEVKAVVVNGTVDIDSELIVGHLNLADSNSILNKCLKMNTIPIQNDASDYSDRASSRYKFGELHVGHCKIVASDNLPLVSELDQTSSVTSNIQPIREDLLVSSSSVTSSSSSSSSPPSAINKTAPNNRKALFELM